MSRDQSSAERAPLCPLCGHRHWGREPHIWTKAKPAADKKPTKKKRPKRG